MYICVCMCVCIYIHIYICVYVWICIYVCMCIYMYIYIYIYKKQLKSLIYKALRCMALMHQWQLLHTLIIIITTPLLYSHYTLFLNIIGNLSIFMYTNLEISIEKNPSYLFVTPLLPPYCTLITPLLHPYRHHHHHHTHIYITLGNLSISMLINLEISIEKSSYYFLITPLLYPHYSLIIQIHNK
jgi:hypothetical protein